MYTGQDLHRYWLWKAPTLCSQVKIDSTRQGYLNNPVLFVRAMNHVVTSQTPPVYMLMYVQLSKEFPLRDQ